MLVAVYGTLKKGLHNYSVMEAAEWKFVETNYVQIESLSDVGFPRILLSTDSDKWLQVEVYEVEKDKIQYLDRLEWYMEWGQHNYYNRVKIPLQDWQQVYIYEYNWSIRDNQLENFFDTAEWETKFYNWTRNYNY